MVSTRTRNDYINRALRVVGAVPRGQNASVTQISQAATALQDVFTELRAEGFDRKKLILTPISLTASSQVTHNSTVYTAIRGHTSSSTNEPGVGAQTTLYWEAKGTAGAAAWVTATAYTAIGHITLDSDIEDIMMAYMKDSNGSDYPVLEIIDEIKYDSIVDKAATGLPYQMNIQYSNPREVFLYTQPDVTTYLLMLLAIKTYTPPTSATSVVGKEAYWDSVIVYKLAATLADEYQRPLPERSWLLAKANKLLLKAKDKEIRTEYNNLSQGAY